MCAPLEPGPNNMESRRLSSISGATLIGNDGTISPLDASLRSTTAPHDFNWDGQVFDRGQWIDLEVLRPKLFEEFRRQYDLPSRQDSKSALSKKTSKVKAWVKQHKLGIDIRLRRKLNAEQDEVTEVHLVNNDTKDKGNVFDDIPELAELGPTELCELADTSVPQELDSVPQPVASGQVPPRDESTSPAYHSRASEQDQQSHGPSPPSSPAFPLLNRSPVDITPPRIIKRKSGTGSQPSKGRSYTFLATDPVPELLSEDDELFESGRTLGLSNTEPKVQPKLMTLSRHRSEVRKDSQGGDVSKTYKPMPKELQAIINAFGSDGDTLNETDVDSTSTPTKVQQKLRPLRVADWSTYETETDAEIRSPLRNKPKRYMSVKKASRMPARRKSGAASKSTFPPEASQSPVLPADKESSDTVGLLRKRTLPKRVPASAGAEALWTSLLQVQGKILGSEHPLVYRAKSDFAQSRAQGHTKNIETLGALQESRTKAIDDLGNVHPWVSTFCDDLSTLEEILGGTAKSQEPISRPRSKSQIPAQQAVDLPSTQTDTIPDSEQVSSLTLSTSHANPRHNVTPLRTANNILRSREPSPSDNDGSALPVKDAQDTHHLSGTSPIAEEPNSAVKESADKKKSPIIKERSTSPVVDLASPTQPPSSLPRIVTNVADAAPPSDTTDAPPSMPQIWNFSRPPHSPRGEFRSLTSLFFSATISCAMSLLVWLKEHFGPEEPVRPGKIRVRWTCACGEQLYDDFEERRPGAGRALEAYLNRPRAHTNGDSPTSPSSSTGTGSFMGSSVGGTASTQTTWSSHGSTFQGSMKGPGDLKNGRTYSGLPLGSPYPQMPEPPWLLTCTNEDRFTPKMAHLDMSPFKIRSDKDLALSLREHYFGVNKKWYRALKLRGLAAVEFVQFEIHQNRFADIRMAPSVPAERGGDYEFEPCDLLPPVGSKYLVHMFKHPRDYDGELITYLRTPKKNGRLQLGMGWGINLVEDFLPGRVWMMICSIFGLGSIAFATVWALKEHDVQGAFGVAAWMVSLAVLAIGWLQASLG